MLGTPTASPFEWRLLFQAPIPRAAWQSGGIWRVTDTDDFILRYFLSTDHFTSDFTVIKTGSCFGTFFISPYIGNNHPNWLIFFRGFQTTNQINYDKLWFTWKEDMIEGSPATFRVDLDGFARRWCGCSWSCWLTRWTLMSKLPGHFKTSYHVIHPWELEHVGIDMNLV